MVQHNPLLDKIRIPGETFTLPSQGLFYTNGELAEDCPNGELHVLPMTAVDEIAFRSVDKLFSGKAIEEVMLRRIPQVKEPMKLLAKDVDYLLTCMRSVSYGPEMEVTFQHDCKDAKEHTYNVNILDFIRAAKKIDPTTYKEKFVVELENGQSVFLRPILFGDIVNVYQVTETLKDTMTDDQATDLAFDTFVAAIQSVDGITDKQMIKEWVAAIPIKMVNEIRDKMEMVGDWGTSFETSQVCKDCGAPIKFTVTTNPIYFFI